MDGRLTPVFFFGNIVALQRALTHPLVFLKAVTCSPLAAAAEGVFTAPSPSSNNGHSGTIQPVRLHASSADRRPDMNAVLYVNRNAEDLGFPHLY